MPVKKSGFGKGLDSLIPNKNVKAQNFCFKSGREKGSRKKKFTKKDEIMVKDQ